MQLSDSSESEVTPEPVSSCCICCLFLSTLSILFINRIKALLGNGLNGIDLVRVWISWRVIPLSHRPGLMCEYTGRKDDPQRHSRNDLPEDVAEDMTKALLNESLADCGRTG